MSTLVISIGNNPTSSDFLILNILRLTLPYRAFTSFTALLKLSQLLLASAIEIPVMSVHRETDSEPACLAPSLHSLLAHFCRQKHASKG
jgi:hypothetical protein